MEGEKNLSNTTLKDMLEFCDIFKAALKLLNKNTNFIFITLLSSLPLFFIMLIFEMIFQSAVVEAWDILDPSDSYLYYIWPVPNFKANRSTETLSLNLVQLSLLFLVPLYITELFSVIVTVKLASKSYTREMPMTFKEMVSEIIKDLDWKSPLITFAYVHILSACMLLGSIWLVTNYYILARNSFPGFLFAGFYAAALLALVKKYLEWTTEWNSSVVMSILEGIHGIDVLVIAAYFVRDSKRHRLLLMSIFFFYGVCLRLPCIYTRCYETAGIGIIAQVGLLCIGNVMKWVVSMVYFLDCRNRLLKETVDEQLESEAKHVDVEATKASDCFKETAINIQI